MKHATDVNDYITSAPQEIQPRLKELRSVIMAAAPGVEERISYGMPYYGYKGALAYFGYAKKHIGLYIPPPIVKDFKEELTDYETATATIRFPLSQDLPFPLIKRLLHARVTCNEQSKK